MTSLPAVQRNLRANPSLHRNAIPTPLSFPANLRITGRHPLFPEIRCKTAFAKRAFVSLARRNPLNQINPCPESQGYLLLAAANAQNRFGRLANHVENSGQRLAFVFMPRVALAAENNVRRRRASSQTRA